MVTAHSSGSWAPDTMNRALRRRPLRPPVLASLHSGPLRCPRPCFSPSPRAPMVTATAGGSRTRVTNRVPGEPPATRGRKTPPGRTIPVSFWCQPGSAGITGPSPRASSKAATIPEVSLRSWRHRWLAKEKATPTMDGGARAVLPSVRRAREAKTCINRPHVSLPPFAWQLSGRIAPIFRMRPLATPCVQPGSRSLY